ncbi:DUF1616 domain-containing protein [Micromonospora sp. NBC_01655]|uniref:hypothetical protein n=1 Tax=Micromonospora sp. NBC_01655 TaxID=2975983 RepID=UPI00225BE00C|nr:hypothetical protein [Micromonospora sp. NBC_01655]MCX4473445.1 DUF1616 domain-containing protein [Micromonospora sp. NBC_01655]
MPSQLTTAPAAAPEGAAPPRRPARPALRLAGWLALAWLGPLLAYAVGAAGVLPVVVFGLAAGLLRAGRTLLDRLVLAGALLFGAVCAAGLLISAWPWGLHPVPVAGAALTGLLGVAAATGRRPRLPRPEAADLLAVGAAVLAALAMAGPYLRAGDLAGRLAYAMTGEDNSRHLAAVQGIGAVGGYLFTDPQAAARTTPEAMVWYPQGFHLTAALLDGFLRSGAPADPVTALDHYLGWAIGAWAALVLAVLWAALRLAGRWLDLPGTLALTGAVTAACLGSELARFVVYGYPGESVGLAATVVLVAVTCRPLARTRTQLCVVGALCVAVGFAYLMFLPVVAALVLAWLVRDRGRLRHHPLLLAAVALATVALTPLPAVGGLLHTDQVDNVATGGGVFPRYDAFLALGGLVAAGLAGGGLRLPVWRRYAGALGAAVAFAAGFLIYFRALGTDPRYYYGKTLHLLLAVLLVGAGALTLLLPAGWRRPPGRAGAAAAGRAGAGGRPGRRWHRLDRPARFLVAAAVVAACAGLAGLPRGTGIFAQPFGDRTTTWSAAWWSGLLDRPRPADVTARALAQAPPRPGAVTVVVSTHRREGYLATLFLSTLQGTAGASGPAVYQLPLSEPARSAALVEAVPGPVRFVAADPAAARIVEDLLAARPDLRPRVTTQTLH